MIIDGIFLPTCYPISDFSINYLNSIIHPLKKWVISQPGANLWNLAKVLIMLKADDHQEVIM